MLATSASAACFAVPSVTATNLAAFLLGASITIVHAPHLVRPDIRKLEEPGTKRLHFQRGVSSKFCRNHS